MPEIAEVETVRNVLKKRILNKRITAVKVLYDKILCNSVYPLDNLINEEFLDIKRMGKWLIFVTQKYVLLTHLRMEGKFFIKPATEKIEKHEHIIIYFGDETLRYHDTRKFGRMILALKEDLLNLKEIKELGIEVNDKNLTKEYLYEKIKNRHIPIKTLLLDQSIISGLGNIYANEVLFRANLNPYKLGSEIKLSECEQIIKSANEIIKKAILNGGTTIKSYTSSLGVTGNYQKYLKVHKKESMPCSVCKNPIKKEFINGRSTYFCPNCQK